MDDQYYYGHTTAAQCINIIYIPFLHLSMTIRKALRVPTTIRQRSAITAPKDAIAGISM